MSARRVQAAVAPVRQCGAVRGDASRRCEQGITNRRDATAGARPELRNCNCVVAHAAQFDSSAPAGIDTFTAPNGLIGAGVRRRRQPSARRLGKPRRRRRPAAWRRDSAYHTVAMLAKKVKISRLFSVQRPLSNPPRALVLRRTHGTAPSRARPPPPHGHHRRAVPTVPSDVLRAGRQWRAPPSSTAPFAAHTTALFSPVRNRRHTARPHCASQMSPLAPPRHPLRARQLPHMSSSSPARVPSIANLLLPQAELPEKSLLTLAAAAAERGAPPPPPPSRSRSSPAIQRELSKGTRLGPRKLSGVARNSLRNGMRGSALGAAVAEQVRAADQATKEVAARHSWRQSQDQQAQQQQGYYHHHENQNQDPTAAATKTNSRSHSDTNSAVDGRSGASPAPTRSDSQSGGTHSHHSHHSPADSIHVVPSVRAAVAAASAAATGSSPAAHNVYASAAQAMRRSAAAAKGEQRQAHVVMELEPLSDERMPDQHQQSSTPQRSHDQFQHRRFSVMPSPSPRQKPAEHPEQYGFTRHHSQPVLTPYGSTPNHGFSQQPQQQPQQHPQQLPPSTPYGMGVSASQRMGGTELTPAMRSLMAVSASAAALGRCGMGSESPKPRTTPDAKRAQNRESAKRFRVAQKKRWAELQDTVAEKDTEIAKLKEMLQEVTESRLPTQRLSATAMAGAVAATAGNGSTPDALVLGELDLLVKLMSAPGGDRSRPSPASNTGYLHRILVATTDGTVTGVRHQQPHDGGATACGGKVGLALWDGVPDGDQLQLRFTVLHATRMGREMAAEPVVFAYRRSIMLPNERAESFVRIKACVHPLIDDSGNVATLLLAEFIET
jgi:Basic region leucine zipper